MTGFLWQLRIELNWQQKGARRRRMEQTILEWLLEEQTPEARLRTLKEYMKLPEDDEEVVNCKGLLLQSKVYERVQKRAGIQGRECRGRE